MGNKKLNYFKKSEVSPSLFVYKAQKNSVISIFQRITGIILLVILLVGLLLLNLSDNFISLSLFYYFIFYGINSSIEFSHISSLGGFMSLFSVLLLNLVLLSLQIHYFISFRNMVWGSIGGNHLIKKDILSIFNNNKYIGFAYQLLLSVLLIIIDLIFLNNIYPFIYLSFIFVYNEYFISNLYLSYVISGRVRNCLILLVHFVILNIGFFSYYIF